jgi:hypothetical protein
MAVQTLQVDGPQAVQIMERTKIIRYRVTLSNNPQGYVQAQRGTNNGELIDLTKALGSGGKEEQFWGARGPAIGYPLQGPGGVGCEILPGADSLHWLLKVYAVGSNNEHAGGNYEASILNDLDFLIAFEGVGGGIS